MPPKTTKHCCSPDVSNKYEFNIYDNKPFSPEEIHCNIYDNSSPRAGSDGSMSTSGSAGPGFDPRQGSKFSFGNFQSWS